MTSRFRPAVSSHAIHRGYVDQVLRAGGLPFVIPCTEAELGAPYLDAVDALLLTGGEDIDPAYCRGTRRQTGYTYHPGRDAFELALTGLALERGIPVLGICRGAQVLYAATGHPLIGHIPDVNGGAVEHRLSLTEPSRHTVTLAEGSEVARAYGERVLKVTSYHHQGLGEPAPGGVRWRVTATADDSLTEAVEREDGGAWAVGVLWHPELPAEDDDRTDPLIAAFVSAASAAGESGSGAGAP